MVLGGLVTGLVLAILWIPFILFFADPEDFVGNQIGRVIEESFSDPDSSLKLEVAELAGPGLIDILSGFISAPLVVIFIILLWAYIAPGWWLYNKLKTRITRQ